MTLAFLTSSMPSGSNELEPGKEVPSISISNLNNPLSEGKTCVLNFWNPSDPESRIRNRNLSRLVATLPTDKISLISVCTTEDEVLHSEILKKDGVQNLNTININSSDIEKDFLKDYQISTGNRSFLINPEGILLSILPEEEEIIKSVKG